MIIVKDGKYLMKKEKIKNWIKKNMNIITYSFIFVFPVNMLKIKYTRYKRFLRRQ